MSGTPKPIHDVAAALDGLPGIGPRAALRYAYWLAAQPKEIIQRFAEAVQNINKNITLCSICNAWSEGLICHICKDEKRDPATLCVVATSQDIRVIEESGAYKGKYHVLGGLLDPIEGKTPDKLNIRNLLLRLSEDKNKISEILLALDPDVSGDTTALYLTKQLSVFQVNITRLARGLQRGAQIEYADGATISDAIKNRR